MSNVTVNRIHSFTGHQDCIYTVQPADQPNLFFSASGDGMVVLWDLQKQNDGDLIAKLSNSVYALHYHQPTELLIVGNNYNGLHLLDWRNKKEIGSLNFTNAAIFDIQSVGSRLFVGDKEGVLSEIDVDNISIKRKISVSGESVRTIAIHPDRGEMAVGTSDNFIRIYDLGSLGLKKEWLAHQNSVFTLRYSVDGSFLFSGSRDARLRVWDVQANYTMAAEVVAHMQAINHIEFSPDSKHFVTCSLDRSIKVWDFDELRLLKVIDKARHNGHRNSVNKLLWTNHLAQLVSAGDDKIISVWDIHVNQGLSS